MKSDTEPASASLGAVEAATPNTESNTKSKAGVDVAADAGAFGRWALLLAGARRNTRAGRERDEVMDAGEGGRGGDTLVAGREV